MRFPFTLRLKQSGHGRVRPFYLIAAVVLAAVVVGTVAYTYTVRPTPVPSTLASETIEVTSIPRGASIAVDGRPRGRTPARLPVEGGDHEIELALSGFGTVIRRVSVAAGQASFVVARLWRHSAAVTELRAPLPGAYIRDPRFLPNGAISLAVTLPNDAGAEVWKIGTDGVTARVTPKTLPTTALALAPDGTTVAYLDGRTVGSPDGRHTYRELWVTRGTGRGSMLFSLPRESDNKLIDLSWSPDGRYILVAAARRALDGGTSRLLLIPTEGGEPRELADLPAAVLAGSYSWSRAGAGVAFLVRSGDTVSLCAVRLDGSSFRYLADVGRVTEGRVGYAPISWSRDGGRILYSAPDKPTTDGSPSIHLIYTDDLSGRPSSRVASAEGQNPVWRDDGHILALARTKDDEPLVLRAVDPDGIARDIGVLPIDAAAFSALWDIEHAQAIVAVPDASGFSSRHTFWLARWAEGAPE